jgi:hypothetical protein
MLTVAAPYSPIRTPAGQVGPRSPLWCLGCACSHRGRRCGGQPLPKLPGGARAVCGSYARPFRVSPLVSSARIIRFCRCATNPPARKAAASVLAPVRTGRHWGRRQQTRAVSIRRRGRMFLTMLGPSRLYECFLARSRTPADCYSAGRFFFRWRSSIGVRMWGDDHRRSPGSAIELARTRTTEGARQWLRAR